MNSRAQPLVKFAFTLLALLLAGCTANPRDDQSANGITPADELQIKEAVFKDLFDFQDVRLHPHRPEISAYVIDDANAKQLAREFSGHTPPVIVTPTFVNDAGLDLDKATGNPVEVYAVRIREISCDHARIGAGWHSAALVGIWYSYDVVRVKGVWMVKSKAVVGIT